MGVDGVCCLIVRIFGLLDYVFGDVVFGVGLVASGLPLPNLTEGFLLPVGGVIGLLVGHVEVLVGHVG